VDIVSVSAFVNVCITQFDALELESTTIPPVILVSLLSAWIEIGQRSGCVRSTQLCLLLSSDPDREIILELASVAVQQYQDCNDIREVR
jgi:hypothetical protein